MKKERPDVTHIAQKHRITTDKVWQVYSDVQSIYASKAGRASVASRTPEEIIAHSAMMVEKRLQKKETKID